MITKQVVPFSSRQNSQGVRHRPDKTQPGAVRAAQTIQTLLHIPQCPQERLLPRPHRAHRVHSRERPPPANARQLRHSIADADANRAHRNMAPRRAGQGLRQPWLQRQAQTDRSSQQASGCVNLWIERWRRCIFYVLYFKHGASKNKI